MKLSFSRLISDRSIIALFIITTSIQFRILTLTSKEELGIPLFIMMLIAPFFLTRALYVSKAMIWGLLYFLSSYFCAIFHPESFRLPSIIYMGMFILTYITFYNLIYRGNVPISYFKTLIERLIIAYGIVLLIQQVFIIIGIEELPIINLLKDQKEWLAFNKAPSLSFEPSHSARILGIAFLALLRIYEIEWKSTSVTVTELYKKSKWTFCIFLWSMITMGSGTAIICLLILLLYFINRRYLVYAIPVLITVIYILPKIEYTPIQRVYNNIEAVQTLDEKSISSTDPSASVRILPFLYTLKHFDLSTAETWFGKGMDTGYKNDKYGRKRMIGGMSDYGLLPYIFALGLIFSTSIRKFFSIETLFFIIVFMAEIRSLYVWWAALMILAATKYYQNRQDIIN